MDDSLASLPPTVLVAVGIALLVLVFVIVRALTSGSKGDAVLVAGPSDSGKTTLLLQLRDGSIHKGTVTSMQANEGSIRVRGDKPSARPIRIVDVPGHPRLRARIFDTHVNAARGVVFLVDSVDFMPKKTEVAEQLYDILTHPVVAGRRLPILLACNKADAGTKAHTVDFIRKRLEKEIDAMRSTRGALAGDDAVAAAAALLGPSTESFTFELLSTRGKGPAVTCASCSAVDAGGAGDVETFLRRCVPAQ